MKLIYPTLVALQLAFTADVSASLADSTQDSSQNSLKRKSNLRFTTRLHSLGMFSFAGVIANESPSVDVGVTYDRRRWGAVLIKGAGIYDHDSPYEFALSMVYYRIVSGRKITITPYTGVVLEQTRKFAGDGSNAVTVVNTLYRASRTISFEHMAQFSNVVAESSSLDWVNRARILFSRGHIDLAVSCWHNNRLFDHDSHISVGASAAVSRISLGDHVLVSTGVSTLYMISSSELPSDLAGNGLALTIAATVN